MGQNGIRFDHGHGQFEIKTISIYARPIAQFTNITKGQGSIKSTIIDCQDLK